MNTKVGKIFSPNCRHYSIILAIVFVTTISIGNSYHIIRLSPKALAQHRLEPTNLGRLPSPIASRLRKRQVDSLGGTLLSDGSRNLLCEDGNCFTPTEDILTSDLDKKSERSIASMLPVNNDKISSSYVMPLKSRTMIYRTGGRQAGQRRFLMSPYMMLVPSPGDRIRMGRVDRIEQPSDIGFNTIVSRSAP